MLELTNQKLGWPAPDAIRAPNGAGARLFAELARSKIQTVIARRADALGIRIGVLARNPDSNQTEPPVAIVAELDRSPTDGLLRELHRLAWNFSHSPTLVTAEPTLLRLWTCCEPPGDRPLDSFLVEKLSTAELLGLSVDDVSQRAVWLLHWSNLVSGQFFRENTTRFKRDKRADTALLSNLAHTRYLLQKQGLKNDDVCHDLLARIVFIQFLFDRKDSAGHSALNQDKLVALAASRILRKEHRDFASILNDYEDTYRLFDWLNERFNGDLFPGKGNTAAAREESWREEKRWIQPIHLEVLRELILGKLDMPRGQLCLWQQYAFDVIPLEFISSIYEAFVSERAKGEGIYYTPPHLVDLVLDRVLPWTGRQWDLKILDPACGSGVFLVKAFQRLIHRWKKGNSGEMRAEILRRLLERNLFGVDKDPHAVRVASFSLYLAMCDEIDPKHYWTQVHFPTLRGNRLINADFFEETKEGFRTDTDSHSYDLVVGNVPWGTDKVSEYAKDWAANNGWPIVEKDIGTLFVPKALKLTKPVGRVSMLQPARTLLFNQRGPAKQLRRKLLTNYCVQEIVNFAALRFELFPEASDPVCAVTINAEPPRGEGLSYVCPKRSFSNNDIPAVIVESLDERRITEQEAVENPFIFSGLMWGHHRDIALIRRLSQRMSLKQLQREGVAKIRRGVSRGDRKRSQPELANRRILESDEFPEGTFLFLDAKSLPVNTDLQAHSKDSVNFEAFALPQLIIKQSWQKALFRFQAAIVRSDEETGPVLCSRSYASVHVPDRMKHLLESAWLSLRSKLAVYFLLLTSGRFAAYREEPNLEDILKVPILENHRKPRQQPSKLLELDSAIREAFELKPSEWVLVEDLFDITLRDFKGGEDSPGRLRTRRTNGSVAEPDLWAYCEHFIRVLKAGFGQDKEISAIIFGDQEQEPLSYRLVAFELNQRLSERIQLRALDRGNLLSELEMLNRTWIQQHGAGGGGIFNQRIVRIYDDQSGIPTVFIVKPDARRYWTRSMGLNDADAVAADFVRWQAEKGPPATLSER